MIQTHTRTVIRGFGLTAMWVRAILIFSLEGVR